MSEDLLTQLDEAITVEPVSDQDPKRFPAKYWPSGAAKGIQKVKYSHDAMIDILITEPTISQDNLAARFGYTASWISQIISSDAFQAKLADRKDALVDPQIRATVEENFKGMIYRSMLLLKEKLNRPAKEIPDNLVLRSLEISSRALGYGVREPPAQQTNVAVEVHLEQLGENLTKLLQRKKSEVIPYEPGESSS